MNPLDLLSHFSPSLIAEREINRLLHEQPTAKTRLAKFADKSASFALGPVQFAFRVQADGSVRSIDLKGAEAETPKKADVAIRGSLEAISAFMKARSAEAKSDAGNHTKSDAGSHSKSDALQSAMAHVTIEGNIGFAQEIAFLAENLRFEPEERVAQGLRRLLPMLPSHAADAAAVQGVAGAKRFVSWSVEASRRLALASSEYLVHENPTLINREAMLQFTNDVESLSHRVERLAKRVEQKNAQKSAQKNKSR